MPACQPVGRSAALGVALLLGSFVLPLAQPTVIAATPSVQFDAAAAVACRDVTPADFARMNPHQRLVEARLEVSSLIRSGSEDDLAEFYYRFTSPTRMLEISDYLPKTTLATDIAGSISIEEKNERNVSLGISVSGAFFHLAKAGADAGIGAKSGKTVRYEKLPPLESVTASGTIDRGSGVYYKLRPSTRTSLEGGAEFVLLLRVPAQWRADYVQLECRATGWRRGPVRALDERATCGCAVFAIALHQEGDEAARAAALDCAAAEGRLRRAAAEIDPSRSPSSLADRFGLFGGGELELPADWLARVLDYPAASEGRYILSRLPAPVRETAMHYLSARNRLAALNRDSTRAAATAPEAAAR
jgi:hypothetical protein